MLLDPQAQIRLMVQARLDAARPTPRRPRQRVVRKRRRLVVLPA